MKKVDVKESAVGEKHVFVSSGTSKVFSSNQFRIEKAHNRLFFSEGPPTARMDYRM